MSTTTSPTSLVSRYETALAERQQLDPLMEAIAARKTCDVEQRQRERPSVKRWLVLQKEVEITQAEIAAQAGLSVCKDAFELLLSQHNRGRPPWRPEDLQPRDVRDAEYYVTLAVAFVVPAAMLVTAYIYKPSWLWIAAIAAAGFGAFTRSVARSALQRKSWTEAASTGFLVNRIRLLAGRLQLTRAASVTVLLVGALGRRHRAELDRQAAEREAEQRRRWAAHKEIRTEQGAERAAMVAAGGAVGATAYAAADEPDYYTDPTQYEPAHYEPSHYDHYEYSDPYGPVNPANGMPMQGGGSCFDVTGDVYGTDTSSEY